MFASPIIFEKKPLEDEINFKEEWNQLNLSLNYAQVRINV